MLQIKYIVLNVFTSKIKWKKILFKNLIYKFKKWIRKYAPRCYICHLSITPEPGQEETVRIVAMDKSFHINCYKCEVWDNKLKSYLEKF